MMKKHKLAHWHGIKRKVAKLRVMKFPYEMRRVFEGVASPPRMHCWANTRYGMHPGWLRQVSRKEGSE